MGTSPEKDHTISAIKKNHYAWYIAWLRDTSNISPEDKVFFVMHFLDKTVSENCLPKYFNAKPSDQKNRRGAC